MIVLVRVGVVEVVSEVRFWLYFVDRVFVDVRV